MPCCSRACRTSPRTSISPPWRRRGAKPGATLSGFANQAQFLINCGLPQLLEAIDPADPEYLDLALQARQLLLPQAMGEAFKVLALTRRGWTIAMG